MIDEDLYQLLTATVDPVPVEQDVIDQDKAYTRVWYQRSGYESTPFIGGAAGLVDDTFAIECMSDSIATVQTLASSIRALNGMRGAMGNSHISALWVDDQADTYVAKNLWAEDAGLHVCALKITITHS